MKENVILSKRSSKKIRNVLATLENVCTFVVLQVDELNHLAGQAVNLLNYLLGIFYAHTLGYWRLPIRKIIVFALVVNASSVSSVYGSRFCLPIKYLLNANRDMEIIKFDYNGNQIPFEKGDNVMVNLTAMAKAYPEKNLSTIVNSHEINEYCASLSKLKNFSLTDLLQVRRGGDNPGTWAHRLVAIRVAQKLNSDLAVWVDMRIEELLTTGVATVSNDDEAIAYAMHVLNKRLEQAKAEKAMLEQQNCFLTNEIKESAPKLKVYNEYISSTGTYTTTQLAKEYGWGAETLNRKLREMGIQYKQNGQWLLYSRYDGKNYTKSIPRTYTRSDGTIGTQMQTVWTSQGREFIHSLFKM